MSAGEFDQKVVVVTGGASGIGRACAEMFAEAGAVVVVADRNVELAQQVAEATHGVAVELDVGDEDSVQNAADRIREQHGRVDVLVNCAGVLQRPLPPGKLSQKEWDIVTRIDIRGTYLCCASFGSAMALMRQGAIVNIASVAGIVSSPLHAYAPAKAGVISLTQSLAAEWGPQRVRVNCVSPGFTETPALNKGISTHTLDADVMRQASALGKIGRAHV